MNDRRAWDVVGSSLSTDLLPLALAIVVRLINKTTLFSLAVLKYNPRLLLALNTTQVLASFL